MTESRTPLKDLVSAGILKPMRDQRVYLLQTPVIIEFSERIAEEILSNYNPDCEIGGVILTEPKSLNGNRVLSAGKIIFLENLSVTPQRQFSRSNIGSDIQRIWEDHSKKDQRLYLPFFFHSHPTVSLNEMDNLGSLVSRLAPLKTSVADQQFSLSVEISINDGNFRVPNALIVRSEIGRQRTLIGFYGAGIAPPDFGKYLLKLTGKTITQLVESLRGWVEEDPKRIWVLLILAGLGALPMVLFPRQAIPLYLVLTMILFGSQVIPISVQEVDGLPNYFATIKKGSILVRIPGSE